MGAIMLDINEIAKSSLVVSVKLKGVRRFNLCVQVAVLIFRIAGWIMPARTVVEVEANEART